MRPAHPDVPGASSAPGNAEGPCGRTALRDVVTCPARHAGRREGQSDWMFVACGPLGPWVTSNETLWFSSSER